MEEIPTNPTCRDTEQVCGRRMDLDPPPSRYHPLQRKGEREGKKKEEPKISNTELWRGIGKTSTSTPAACGRAERTWQEVHEEDEEG